MSFEQRWLERRRDNEPLDVAGIFSWHSKHRSGVWYGHVLFDYRPSRAQIGFTICRNRTSPAGEPILLENQDRSLWNREQIAEGVALLEKALKSRRFGSYTLQAAITAVHAEAESVTVTDWRQIVALYDRLLRIQPSPVVELNRAVAIAMCEGLEQGLRLIDDLLASERLSHYHLAHSARADLCRRLGRIPEA